MFVPLVPLLQLCILKAEHCCRLQGLWLGDSGKFLFPPVVCTVLFSTMNVSQ